MRISDWSSDVCSSDLVGKRGVSRIEAPELARSRRPLVDGGGHLCPTFASQEAHLLIDDPRSEEHTSELPSLMRISYAVFCLKKKNKNIQEHMRTNHDAFEYNSLQNTNQTRTNTR